MRNAHTPVFFRTILGLILIAMIFPGIGESASRITQTPAPPTQTPSPTATAPGGSHYLAVDSLPACSEALVINVTGSTVPYSNIDIYIIDLETSDNRHVYQWTNSSAFSIPITLFDDTLNGITVRSCGDVYPPPCTTISYVSRPDLIVDTGDCSTATPTAPPTPVISATPAPPSSTPTVVPTSTPPDEPTATPSVAPCDVPGVTLKMPAHEFHAGDPCWLDVIVCNPTEETWDTFRLLVLLEIYGQYFFAPSWSPDIDWLDEEFPPGETTIRLFEFAWPEGLGETPWFRFYAGIFTDDMTALIGAIGYWEFRGI